MNYLLDWAAWMIWINLVQLIAIKIKKQKPSEHIPFLCCWNVLASIYYGSVLISFS
jgi:hypothetical protein